MVDAALDVPDAPAGAKPMATARYDDNGLATYSLSWLPPTFREEADVKDPEPL